MIKKEYDVYMYEHTKKNYHMKINNSIGKKLENA